MWMRFPDNTSGISVEQQEFKPEFIDKDERRYARFPDHFVPRVLDLNMGFAVVGQPEGAPEDLPPSEQTSAIADMGIQVNRLNEDLVHLQAANRTLSEDNTKLKAENATLRAEMSRRDTAETAVAAKK